MHPEPCGPAVWCCAVLSYAAFLSKLSRGRRRQGRRAHTVKAGRVLELEHVLYFTCNESFDEQLPAACRRRSRRRLLSAMVPTVRFKPTHFVPIPRIGRRLFTQVACDVAITRGRTYVLLLD